MSDGRPLKGLHQHRFNDNPEERVFAEAGHKINDVAGRSAATLEWLLGDGSRPAAISERDEDVAATVLQWLGSPVGQGFLRDLGYVKDQKR